MTKDVSVLPLGSFFSGLYTERKWKIRGMYTVLMPIEKSSVMWKGRHGLVSPHLTASKGFLRIM